MNHQNVDEKIVSWLFETHAIRVAPADKPFWYTSGTIGPYYSNTHFLYGSEAKANDLLSLIDKVKHEGTGCPGIILAQLRKNYEADSIYRNLIDGMVAFIQNHIPVEEMDGISCGERRDWFFAPIIADMLKKPCIYIFKDLSAVKAEGAATMGIKGNNSLKGQRILHIADLITEASSYTRAWIPAIEELGGTIKWSLVVVDRNQGGGKILEEREIQSFAMVKIDEQLFDRALQQGYITKAQHEQIIAYTRDPKATMEKFLRENPAFLQDTLQGQDEKTKERARLMLAQNLYHLG